MTYIKKELSPSQKIVDYNLLQCQHTKMNKSNYFFCQINLLILALYVGVRQTDHLSAADDRSVKPGT